VQASGQFRSDLATVKRLKVRNSQGEMVPLGAVLSIKEIDGPINIGRYNMYPRPARHPRRHAGWRIHRRGIEEMERLCHEAIGRRDGVRVE